MLSPRDDDDDDSHLCIKCNATLIGLDNYIKHRKERCGKKIAKPHIPTIDHLEPSYNLGADVFFQSLELQSSVKKPTLSRLSPPLPKPIDKDRKHDIAVPSTSRDIPPISPLDNNLRGEDWIGGHSLRIGNVSNEDNQTKLINAVANISGAVKKFIPTSTYSIPYNDYKADEDSEESDDLDDDEDEEVHPSGGKWKPPPNYTGGKWRPVSPENDEWIRDEQDHMEGKWKHIMADTNDREDDFDAPPPDHTKGKWVPGANEKTQIMQPTIQSKGSVQYWCGPCNRRLGSKAIYDKHLRSKLHMKKVLPEHELEFAGHLNPVRDSDKRPAKPSKYVDDSMCFQQRKKRNANKALNLSIKKKKRKRKLNFVNCSGCKSRVRSQLMGKHLISHYHFRKTTDTQSEAYKKLICDNTEAIVHQSPFQCSPCKFYTNWMSDFIQHWFSEEHEKIMTSIEGRYWCSFCKFECDISQEMVQHMSGPDHSEVVAAINRSMPIIIRKKSVIRCETCHKEFRYNIEMKRHCEEMDHQMSYSGTDDYQDTHKCQHCPAKFKSSVMLAAHLRFSHKQKAYLCLVCAKTFKTAKEAYGHRQTMEHRIRQKEKQKQKGLPVKDMTKKCPYCTEKVIMKNVLELKEHIRRIHPDIKKKCPKCGMSFVLPQEVTQHIRKKACQFQESPLNASIVWSCSQCPYTTDSQAECFFHEVLHSSPTKIYEVDEEKGLEKYPCPLCSKEFRKISLRCHLRQHTFERPYVCAICGSNFTRQGSLKNHTRNEHGNRVKEPQLATIAEKAEMLDCGQCKKSFHNKTAFSRHLPNCKVSEERRCPHHQCNYVAITAAQLIRHRHTHGERVKHHECPYCNFKGSQASHLKRHMVCHKGIKPYACPHCEFTCGSLENLRKHVLRGARHRDVFLYNCKHCTYKTNMAGELRTHLTNSHSDKYDLKTAAEAAKTHLMVAELANAETDSSLAMSSILNDP